MKVLVAVKTVARLEGERELNDWDAFSLEAALQLVEEAGRGEVVVATVGAEEAEEALLACLAKGADRGIRVWDPALEGGDSLAVASVLAALAGREEPDLILAGVQSSDAANAATGVALAGLLDLPRVAVVKAIEREDEDNLLVRRDIGGGGTETLRVPLPALLTVQAGINTPRHANLRAIKRAPEKPRETLALAELRVGADRVLAAAGARTLALATPDQANGASMLEGSPSAIAERIAEIVRSEIAA